jgi:DNA-binding ferritin-like protein
MEEAIRYFLTLTNQIKLYHWATTSYSAHKALDKLYSGMAELTDKFIECYIGHFKKQPLKASKLKLDLAISGDMTQIRRFLTTQCDQLQEMVRTYKDTPGLENILAEMVALFDQTIYLTNLH